MTVNWNQADKTIACLQSIQGLAGGSVHTYVVDNGSTDGSSEKIEAAVSAGWMELMRLDENIGFARGYNHALRRAMAAGYELILLINNDVILDSASVDHLVAAAEAHSQAGLLTAKIYFEGTDIIWTLGAYLSRTTLEITGSKRGAVDHGQFEAPAIIEFAPLCGVLLRTDMLRDVGLLDEEFFVYYEDMDFAWRVLQSGWEMRAVPAAVIWHAVSASSGGQDSPLERYWMGQGSGRYFRKHASPTRLFFIIFPYRLLSALKTTARLLGQGRWTAVRAYWLGLTRGWITGRSIRQPPAWVLNNRGETPIHPRK